MTRSRLTLEDKIAMMSAETLRVLAGRSGSRCPEQRWKAVYARNELNQRDREATFGE